MSDFNRESREYLTASELHNEEVRLLLSFHNFCKQHNIRYSLNGGTLLGAIRHKGFIPWDDDIDVCLPRPDYDRLLAMRDDLPDGMRIIDAGTSGFVFPFAKLFDTSIRVQEPGYEGVMEEYLWIDLFPMDGVPDDIHDLNRMKSQVNWATRACSYSYEQRGFFDSPKDSIKCVLGFFLRLFGDSRKRLIRVMNDVVHWPGYANSEMVAEVLYAPSAVSIVSKAEFENLIDVEFEGHKLKAMSCWDNYLTQTYGDYMKLPPESMRVTHGVKAWRIF